MSTYPVSGGVTEGPTLRTTRERVEEMRQAKPEPVRQHVESGSPVIRRMPGHERRRYPACPARPNQARGR